MIKRYCVKCGGCVCKHGKTAAGTQRWQCSYCKHRSVATSDVAKKKVTYAPTVRYTKYLITAAQNATPVYRPFLESLQTYARAIHAGILVIPFRYHNPTSLWVKEDQNEDWWAPEIHPYLCNQRLRIGDHFEVVGDVSIQPTASSPLSGMEMLSRDKSAIFGHPRLELKSVPTPHLSVPKIVSTTGVVTKPNYTPTKAGSKAEFYHTIGAAIVEVSNGAYHLRQIISKKDGSFIDLDKQVSGKKISQAPRAEALVCGDLHEEFMEPYVDQATFGDGSIAELLNPKYCVLHDAWDGFQVNPHHMNKPLSTGVKVLNGRNKVEEGIDRLFTYLEGKLRDNMKFVVVASNHNEFLSRWLEATDPRSDPVNARVWCALYCGMLNSGRIEDNGIYLPDALQTYYRLNSYKWKALRGKIKFLERGESFRKLNVEMSYHGDKGAGGSRGSSKQFGGIATKTISAHGHNVSINSGNFQVGTSGSLRADYTLGGLTNHVNAHCVLYSNGARSLVMILPDGSWHSAD